MFECGYVEWMREEAHVDEGWVEGPGGLEGYRTACEVSGIKQTGSIRGNRVHTRVRLSNDIVSAHDSPWKWVQSSALNETKVSDDNDRTMSASGMSSQ